MARPMTYTPNPSPPEWHGRVRYRCRTCNHLFLEPGVHRAPWGSASYGCPSCGKPPRQPKCGPAIYPPPEEGYGARINEHTVVW